MVLAPVQKIQECFALPVRIEKEPIRNGRSYEYSSNGNRLYSAYRFLLTRSYLVSRNGTKYYNLLWMGTGMKRHEAIRLDRSMFEKTIKSPLETKIIKSIKNNRKMGGGKYSLVQKGKYIGLPFYKVSLEERKTCPDTCTIRDKCYGNNMPFAHRIDHTHPKFFSKLKLEIDELLLINPLGFVVRLHELGDFFSLGYTAFWMHRVQENEKLKLIGFTAHKKETQIGRLIQLINCYDNVDIRFSGEDTVISDTKVEGSFTCPAQLDTKISCASCTLCWDSKVQVRFKEH